RMFLMAQRKVVILRSRRQAASRRTHKPMSTNRRPPHPATIAAQALGWTDAATGAVVLPIQPATTYIRDPDNQYRRGRNYARADNPGSDQPQALLTALEGGAASMVLSSGMAAATTLFRALPLGAHIVG